MKRYLSAILSVLLISVMLLSMIPASVSADTITATKVSTIDDIDADKKYVLVVNNKNVALTTLDGSWVLVESVAPSSGIISNIADNMLWTITVSGSSATLTDSNGVTIKPGAGNINGIQSGNYNWDVSVADGLFKFKGVDDDTTTLAANAGSSNKVKAYKNGTIEGNPAGYPTEFAIYEVNGSTGGSGGSGGTTPTPTPTYISIAEARAATDGATVYTEGTVVFSYGKDAIVYDPTSNVGIALYFGSGSTLTVGDKVKVKGTRDDFNGCIQLASPEVISTSTGDSFSHVLKTVSAIMADTNLALESTPIRLEEVEITNIKDETDGSKTVTISDGAKSVNIYKAPALPSGVDAGDTVNVNNAIVSSYKGTPQLKIASASDIVLVSSGTVTINYVDIEDALAASGLIGTEGIVIFIDDKNAVIYDGKAGINLFFNNAGHTLSIGDKIKVNGVRGDFNGLQQLTSPTVENTISTGNTITYNASTIAAILADTTGAIESTPVKLENVVLGEIKIDGNTVITDASGNTINIRLIPVLVGINEGDTVTINAVVSDYNGYQLKVASASDITLVSSGAQGGGSAETGDATAAIAISAVVAAISLAGVHFTKKRTLAD